MEFSPIQRIINYFFALKGWDYKDPKYKGVYGSFVKAAKGLLEAAGGDPLVVKAKIDEVKSWHEARELSWNLRTVLSRWFEDHGAQKQRFTREGNPVKEKDGKLMVKIHTGEWKFYNDDKSKLIWR